MSIGPSALGTVLVQRLDAVLGTTMAGHGNLVSGARPDAVAQPGEPARLGQSDHASRAPRAPVDPASARGDRGTTIKDARQADSSEQPARGLLTRSETTASAPTTLGHTARTILALLTLYPDQAPPARGKDALWLPAARGMQAALPLPAAAALASALRQALQSSGLFYESHLRELVHGKRSADELRAEPQAALPRASQLPADTAPRSLTSRGAAVTADGAAGTPAPAPMPAGIHPDAAPLVRQQLDILANHTLIWQGEAWPDSPMEWEVSRDGPHEAADGIAHWTTRVKLDLPRLGLVEARLSLAGEQLVMQLVAPRSSREINAASNALRQTLQRAGLTLSHMSVSAAPAPATGAGP